MADSLNASGYSLFFSSVRIDPIGLFYYLEEYFKKRKRGIMEKDWKCVYLSGHLYQAEIARDILENNGIKSVILNKKDSVYRTYGDIELYVHENNEQQALELIKDLKN